MNTDEKIKILRTYGNFRSGMHENVIPRHYAAVYRFGHPILFTASDESGAVARLFADIHMLMWKDVLDQKKGIAPLT